MAGYYFFKERLLRKCKIIHGKAASCDNSGREAGLFMN